MILSTNGISSLVASAQESWMHGSQSFFVSRETLQYVNCYSSELLILRSALINIE